jgi:nucleoside-triphosphatase THEP1
VCDATQRVDLNLVLNRVNTQQLATRMALIGSIGPFDCTVDSWSSYQERLEQFLAANDIPNDKRVAVLLSVIGGKAYNELRSLTAPAKPKDKSFKVLCETMTSHFSPKPLIIAERFRFYKRNQRAGESIAEYCVAIQRLTEHCEFGTTLNDALRDRLVCGLANEHVQRKLLVEADLTYERAKAIAIASETATKDAEELRRQPAAVEVNKLKAGRSADFNYSKSTAKGFVACTRCGKNNHEQSQCYFKDKVCHKCSKLGHTQKMCRSKVNLPTQRPRTGKVNQLEEHSDDSSDMEAGLLNWVEAKDENSVNRMTVKPITMNIDVNGRNVEMELDSGSPVSLIPVSKYRELFADLPLQSSELRLSTFTGEPLQVCGFIAVTVQYNNQRYNMKLHVVSQGNTALFGRDWLQEIRLDWNQIHQIKTCETAPGSLTQITNRYSRLFSDELGKLSNFQAKLYLKDNVAPVFMRARTVPYAMRPKIEQELDRLEAEGVLTKSSRSEWATPIVPIVKSNGQIRICGDYKITVNPALQIDQYPLPKPQDIFASLAGGQKFSKLDLRQAYLQCEVDDQTKELLTLNTHKGLY